MSHQKQSTGRGQPHSDDPPNYDPINGTRHVGIHHRLSPHHSPLLKLLPLAPNQDFTKQLRDRLRLVQFQQGIRRDLYGEATAEEYLIGHTPDALREEARASPSMDDSSSSEPSNSPRCFDDEHWSKATPVRHSKARHERQRSTDQPTLPKSVGKQSRLNHPEASQVWPSLPSSSYIDPPPPNATAGEDSRAPKCKRSDNDGAGTAIPRRSKRLRREPPVEASS